MRIAILTTHLPPVMGGIEIHCHNLATALAQSGHDVVLYGSLEPHQDSSMRVERRCDNLLVRRIPTVFRGPLRRPSRFWNLAKALRADHNQRPFEIIHAHQLFPVSVAAAHYARRLGSRLIITEHGSILDDHKIPWRRAMIRHAAKRASAIITASEELAGSVKDAGVPHGLIHAMPNAIWPEQFNVSDDGGALRKRLGIDSGDFVAMTVRRLYPKNGVQYAVKAVPQCVARIPHFRLVVVGDGPLRPSLQETARRLHVEDHVRFVEAVPNVQVPRYMRMADIGVFPSLAEATSIAALEFMASGTPVVASTVGGLPEIVADGTTGFLFDIGFTASRYDDPGLPIESVQNLVQAIVRAYRADRSTIGRNARRAAEEKFSWRAYVRHLERDFYAKAT